MARTCTRATPSCVSSAVHLWVYGPSLHRRLKRSCVTRPCCHSRANGCPFRHGRPVNRAVPTVRARGGRAPGAFGLMFDYEVSLERYARVRTSPRSARSAGERVVHTAPQARSILTEHETELAT